MLGRAVQSGIIALEQKGTYMNRKNLVLVLGILAAMTACTQAATLKVGPGRLYATVQSAVSAAASGDTIEIDPGTYYVSNGWAAINTNLTIRGVGAVRPVIDGTGLSLNGKALFLVNATVTIQNLEFCHCSCGSQNGSGILVESGSATIQNCYFHDNDDGVRGGAGPITMEYCEFYHNGYGDGYSHNMYIAAGTSTFTMRYCYSHGTVEGHEIKTRANNNYVLYSLLVSENTGSRELQFTQGGNCYSIGNVIVKGPNSHNNEMITYGGEGTNANPNLYVINNTLINFKGGTVGLAMYNNPTTAVLQNTIMQNVGTTISGSYASKVTQTTNWFTSNAYLVNSNISNLSTFDARLTSSSTNAIDKGTTPGTGYGGYALNPASQYLAPLSYQTRSNVGTKIDIGAYEYGIAVPNNQAPVVSASSDQSSIVWPANSVTLTGTAGDDGLPSTGSLAFTWRELSGPDVVVFSNPAGPVSTSPFTTTATFRAPGTYVLQLAGGDGALLSTQNLTINVIANQAPVVNAGSAQTAYWPYAATLSGSATDDGLPNPPAALTYTWSKISGNGNVVFANPNAAGTTATFGAPGTYVLQLAASDGDLTGTATVAVNVVIDYGPVVTTTLYVETTMPAAATLTGSATETDPPAPLTYTWSMLSGPGTVTFADPHSASTTATFSAPGIYQLQLAVSDSIVTTSGSTTVHVYAGNTAPVVNAGTDQTITLPATATLVGSATDDGLPNPPGALAYTWSKVSGPGSVTFGNPSAAGTIATFSDAGAYVLQLAAFDGALTGTDTVTVNVNAAPTVQAGSGPAFAYEQWPVTLTCSASSSGGLLTYDWTQIAGKEVSLTDETTSSVSFVAPTLVRVTDGALAFKITVTDGIGGTANDTVDMQVYMTGDIDHDNSVVLSDLKLLVAAWGSSEGSPPTGSWNAAADLDASGAINLGDLKLLVQNWGRGLLP